VAAVGNAVGDGLQVGRRADRVVVAGDGQQGALDACDVAAQIGPGQRAA
jgi:hypothetical protein